MHTSARNMRNTDWSQVVALYDRLDPSPVIALKPGHCGRRTASPGVALAIVGRLAAALDGYYHAYRAGRDLLRRLGRSHSRAAYDRAIELAGNTGETASVIRRRERGPLLAVSHAFVIAWFVRLAMDAPAHRWMGLNPSNASLTVIDIRQGGPYLQSFNDAGHLLPEP